MAESSEHGTNGRAPQRGYQDVDRLTNADGIVAVISQRRRTGVLTFAMFREFENDGRKEQTSFVPEYLAASFALLLTKVIARMAELKDSGRLPFPLPTYRPPSAAAR